MKKMIIMRGLPGSGKSSLAKNLPGVYCSADDFFVGSDGVYRFDHSQIRNAHIDCQKKAANAAMMGYSIIVDNTNTTYREIEPYLIIADRHGYGVELVEPDTTWKFDVNVLVEKNTHGVPREAIQRMKTRYESYMTILASAEKNNLLNVFNPHWTPVAA